MEMHDQPPSTAGTRSNGRIVLWLVAAIALFVFGAASFSGSWDEYRNESGLQDDGEIVEANVTDARTVENRRGRVIHHDVKYSFLSSNDVEISYNDGIGDENDWAQIPEKEFEDATKTGRISVRYLPSDPWVNRPDARKVPMQDTYGMLALGAACIVLGLVALWKMVGAIRNRV